MPEAFTVTPAMQAVFAHLDAWPGLLDLMAPPVVVRAGGSADPVYPSIEYTVVSLGLGENLIGPLLQLDLYAPDADVGQALVAELFRALHVENARDFAGTSLVVRLSNWRQGEPPDEGKSLEHVDVRIITGRE